MTGQTIRHMRLLSAGMGITFAELVRRRFKKELANVAGFADQTGTVHLRPRVLCEPSLDGHRLIPKTFTT